MQNILLIIQTLLALFLIVLIFMQSQGTGFSRSWKGSASFTRRGLEKIVFKATFFVSGLFIIVSLLSIVL